MFNFMSVIRKNLPHPMLTIENNELADCLPGIVHLVVPDGIKAIHSCALTEIQGTLRTVVIPEGIETIRANTFQNCKHLVSVKLPESVRSIRTKAFANCMNLREINFPENIKDIAEDAFLNCPNIIIPSSFAEKQNSAVGMAASFKHIPDKTYYIDDLLVQGGFDTPKNLVMKDGVTVIGKGAFAFFGLKTVVVPDGVEAIGEGAFALCDEMESIRLPDTLIEIGKDAFSCCSKLKEINFPDSIRYVGEGAFNKCRRLTLPQRIIDLMENPKPYFSENEKSLSAVGTEDVYTERLTVTQQYTLEHKKRHWE